LIRQANKYDIDKIIDLIKDFAIHSQNPMAHNPLKWSKNYIIQILSQILAGQGFILIDEDETGILIAIKTECFWCKDIYQLQEVMLHGKNKIVIARLIKEYVKISQAMLLNEEINEACFGSYGNTNLEKFGMIKTQNLWRVNNG
jgi:hypothetical protein